MDNMKESVKESYARAINKYTQTPVQSSCCAPSETGEASTQASCCPPTTSEEKKEATIPSFGCVVSLSAKADIKEGEVVVDLGSGAGHDVFQAAGLVGPKGRVIGIDFTPDMITAAMKTAAEKGYQNVEFRLSDIENINVLPDNFADVIISNCVINLTLDKGAVFKEAFRILKPGGRLVDADIIAVNPLPTEVTQDPNAWCSCLGGALTKEGYFEKIEEAGFKNIEAITYDTFENLGNKFQNGILKAFKPL
jgi:SAM-dependent methyltransferase